MRVGLDVGGTKTDAVAVDDADTITARVRLATGWGPDGVVRTIVDAVAALVDAGLDRAAITAVGVGMPGHVGSDSAHVLHAVNLGIADLDLAAVVEPVLGVPVGIENDVKAAALGADALRGRRGDTMAYLNLGTGIAAGIVADGRLWRGTRGTAGEVGHISVDPDGPVCTCGQRGCVEALAGGAAIARRWGRAAPLPVADMLDAAAAGDERAIGLRRDLMRGVAAAVRILVLTADVDTVVIGGGVSALGDRLVTGVADELAASAGSSAFIRSLRLTERMQLLPPGSPAAALGAALVGAPHGYDTRERLVHG